MNNNQKNVEFNDIFNYICDCNTRLGIDKIIINPNL
jgi:hypothetical protein